MLRRSGGKGLQVENVESAPGLVVAQAHMEKKATKVKKEETIAKWSTKMLEEVVNKRGYTDTEEMTQWRNIRRVLMCCGWICAAKWMRSPGAEQG